MEFHGLVVVGEQRKENGVVRYVLEVDPDLAWKGIRTERVWKLPWPYNLAIHGMIIRNFAAIRRDFPYLFLLTNDTPPDSRAKTHLDSIDGLIDGSFVGRFPHAIVHVDYGREVFVFRSGPGIFSRLFEIGREDITYLWPALINYCYDRIGYYLLYAREKVPLKKLANAMNRAQSEDEFDENTLSLVDIMAYVYDHPLLNFHTMSDIVIAEVDSKLPRDPRFVPAEPAKLAGRLSGPSS